MVYSKCKSCGKPIIWAKNLATLKNVPVDTDLPDPLPKPIYRLSTEGSLTVATPVEQGDMDEDSLYGVNHFKTCPNAQQHNRGNK